MTQEKAFTGFGSGICCSMAVFGEMAPRLGLDETQAKKIAAGFGGGMDHAGACGCVTGALMALGLKYGNSAPGEMEQMHIFREKKMEFEKKFTERFNSLVCPEILGGLDPAVPEQKAVIIEKGLMNSTCAAAVCAACEILEEIFDEDLD